MSGDGRIRIGVVGGGFGASFHFHEHPLAEVVAVSDLLPDRRAHLQQRYRCETAYESLDALLTDERLDAVAIFTGAPDHVRHCVAVMDRGLHCMSAVPAACSLEECALLVETTERTGVRYMMAETSYYRADAITARRLYEDGAFGELVYSEVEYYHPLIGAAGDSLSVADGERTWRYGYPPQLYPTHSTGFLVGVTGERLVTVSCGATQGDDYGFADNIYGNPFDNACALFMTDRGHLCRSNVMWNVWNHGERAQWMGTRSSLFAESWSGQPYTIRSMDSGDVVPPGDYSHLLPEQMRYDSGHGGSHPFLTHEFVSAVAEGREPAVDVYEAVAMTAPGIVAQESALRGGEQLPVPSFDPPGKE